MSFVASKGILMHNIGAEDILDGNLKIMLGLIWMLILRFSIAEINEQGLSAKEGLLLWVQRKTQSYANVHVTNFTSSWSSGLALCALIHKHRPDLIDFESLDPNEYRQNIELGYNIMQTNFNVKVRADITYVTQKLILRD